jgi:hypothetical protein
MSRLLLDSGGVSHLARRSDLAAQALIRLKEEGLWPPIVPSVVLVECLTGRPRTDALVHRLLRTCTTVERVPRSLAQRAAGLRAAARRGSAVDAILVASAEPGGTILTGDVADLRALAAHADDVEVVRI